MIDLKEQYFVYICTKPNEADIFVRKLRIQTHDHLRFLEYIEASLFKRTPL
jgi:hypothetical protein